VPALLPVRLPGHPQPGVEHAVGEADEGVHGWRGHVVVPQDQQPPRTQRAPDGCHEGVEAPRLAVMQADEAGHEIHAGVSHGIPADRGVVVEGHEAAQPAQLPPLHDVHRRKARRHVVDQHQGSREAHVPAQRADVASRRADLDVTVELAACVQQLRGLAGHLPLLPAQGRQRVGQVGQEGLDLRQPRL
jgi:hypothetical protein